MIEKSGVFQRVYIIGFLNTKWFERLEFLDSKKWRVSERVYTGWAKKIAVTFANKNFLCSPLTNFLLSNVLLFSLAILD